MATGTPGHFGGGAKGGGKYDTATQTTRGGSKGGFAGKGSTVRPLTPEEHQAAADHLAAAGQHHAAAHHRSSAEQLQGQAPPANKGLGHKNPAIPAPSDNDGDEPTAAAPSASPKKKFGIKKPE